MADTDRLAKELAGILRSSGSRQTKAYDTPAVVRRVDGSTAWVHIPGGVDETPVQLTVAASAGDTVQVRVSGGTAWIVGNASAPPTDDKAARAAQETADVAVTEAEAASEMSTEARQVARAAAKIAGDTEQHFWFTETGADTGAHITEKTQEDFLADPDNGGGNMLARSNGIAVRDGLREISTFSADGFSVNNELDANVLKTGFDADSNYNHLEAISYSNESPFTFYLNWDIRSGYENSLTFEFFTNYPSTTATGITTSGHYTANGNEVTFDSTLCAQLVSKSVTAIRVQYWAAGRFPFYTLGTRGPGTVGEFSTVIGENCVADGSTSLAVGESTRANGTNSFAAGRESYAATNGAAIGRGARTNWEGQFACGKWNIAPVLGTIFSVGAGTGASARRDAFRVTESGDAYCYEDTAGISAALSAMGWSSVLSSNMLNIKELLEELITRLSLFDKQLVNNANWSSGDLSVPGSSKYRVFEVVQGGAAVIAMRYGNSLRGFALSGNATSGNYNQYVRAFGATADWSTEVWTMEWAKQLSHVTSSGYHTSGTEQAITEIRGLIPLQNA